MHPITKRNILANSQMLSEQEIKTIIETGAITLEEFREAGVPVDLLRSISQSIQSDSVQENKMKAMNAHKEQLLEDIRSGKKSVEEFKTDLSNGTINEQDLRNCGLSEKTIASINYYTGKNRGFTIFKTISELPPMAADRTDIYFVGLPGTGKSTMLAGLLYEAHKDGILLPDTYNNDGSVYQNQIISDLTKGTLPLQTAVGSFNYIAMSIADEDGAKHPFNVVEVPGELYKNLYQNSNVDELMHYIKNDNKKILIFTIDSNAHDNGYVEGGLDQSLVYLNILNIFKNHGIIDQVDAIYLVANKFDTIKASRYLSDNRPDVQLALDFLNDEFKSLINNCKTIREESKNKFKIKVLPFSIGQVSHTFILNDFRRDYPKELIRNILEDSFVVTKQKWGLFRK